MRHTERDAVAAFKTAYPHCEPAFRELVADFLGVEIFSVWYRDSEDEEWETAYPCFSQKHGNQVFGDSKELFAFLSTIQQSRSSISTTYIREVVAAVSFLSSVAAIIFLVIYRTINGGSTSDLLVIGLLSLVASGSVLFFKNWTLFNGKNEKSRITVD